MHSDFSIQHCVALLVAFIATITDLRTYKIYNWLTFPAAIIGVGLTAWRFATNANTTNPIAGALIGAALAIAGWVIAVLIMTLVKMKLTYAGEFGHGDSKLMGAIGAFTGPQEILWILWYYCITFGIWYFIRVFPHLPWAQLMIAFKTGSLRGVNMQEVRKVGKETLPVAPIIAVATLAFFLLGDPTVYIFGSK